MKYIKQLTIILAVSFIGEVLHYVLPLPVPASIYGLVIMLAALVSGCIPLSAVEETADFLVSVMPVMFIPAAVGLMETGSSLGSTAVGLVVITAVTTILVMTVTGRVTQLFISMGRKKK